MIAKKKSDLSINLQNNGQIVIQKSSKNINYAIGIFQLILIN